MRTIASTAAACATLALVVALTGCSGISDTAHGVYTQAHGDRDAAEAGWVGVAFPSWIPEDATNIRSTSTTDETMAVIAVESETGPIGCEMAERRSLPFDGRYGSVETAGGLPLEVFSCGAYEVAKADDGWIGWFTPTDQGQTPDDV